MCFLITGNTQKDAFCICSAWHAYHTCLKHNNFICGLIPVSHILPSNFPFKSHAKKNCAKKRYPPFIHMSPFYSLISSLSNWLYNFPFLRKNSSEVVWTLKPKMQAITDVSQIEVKIRWKKWRLTWRLFPSEQHNTFQFMNIGYFPIYSDFI